MTLPALVEELAGGIFEIGSHFGQRRLHQHLICGSDGGAVLIDAGISETPDEVIAPALAEVGLDFDALRWLVITHPDVDHQGGAAGVLARASHCRCACGFLDLPMVSDPRTMVEQRYRPYVAEHGLDLDHSEVEDVMAACGAPIEIDLALFGGETLPLEGRELRVHHVPGHSAGHVAISDAETGIMVMADAVHGRMSPSVVGGRALPPTYEDVDAYLTTIARTKAIGPKVLCSGHLPMIGGDGIGAFLEDSAAFVDELDTFLLDCLQSPATLAQLCAAANSHFGPYSAGPAMFRFAVHGHLRRLVRRGAVELDQPLGIPRRYLATQPAGV